MVKKTIASESVSYGHPDKIADQIGDAILDEYLKNDANTRAGIEVMVKDNIVVLGGEINSVTTLVDYDKVVRSVFKDLNFPSNHNLSPDNIKIINLIGKQSSEIHQGVDKDEKTIGAGDQGFMVGFASNETPVYMPIGIYVAKKICQYIATREGSQFGPDTKSQVIVDYDENGKGKITSILVSTMSQNSLAATRQIVKQIIEDNLMKLEDDLFNEYIKDKKIKIDVNPCGSWQIGGPVSDCGVTGRKLVVDSYGGYCNIGGGAMCVDADTEYIGDDYKWHKISEYDGGKIGQWNNGLLEFVKPSAYHVNPAEKMYHFKTPDTIDMVLSENHDIVCKTSKNNLHKVKVKDVITKSKTLTDGFKDSIPCTFEFYPNSNGINLTDDQIRLQVAVCADGSYSSMPGDKCRINIRKKNKIERLEWLLDRTGTQYSLINKGEYQNHYYTFIPPVPNNKSLYSIFKNANFHQLCIVAKEVIKWDGSESEDVFRTTVKEDADFIQFIFSIVFGKRVSIWHDDRIGEIRSLNDKEYVRHSILYEVTVGKIKEISMGSKKDRMNITDYNCDMMYCFTVPSGMLLLRRNDKIFVTGNCGKDYSKVDRSGAYMARYLAKNIVASGLCNTAKVELSYMIGVPEPSSINIEMDRNQGKAEAIKTWIKKNVDLTPYGIISWFNGAYPRNYHLSKYGHFGVNPASTLERQLYPWENLDLVNALKNEFLN